MRSFWDKQIERADELAETAIGSKELLSFYAQLLRAQRKMYESFVAETDLPSGHVQNDLALIKNATPHLLETVSSYGSTTLATEARELSQGGMQTFEEQIHSYWTNPSDIQFFGKAVLQPYARWLRHVGVEPVGRELPAGAGKCPFCGGNPQVSFLQAKEPGTESGNRDLICAMCLSPWEFRRVLCVNCGEQRPDRIGYFHSPEFEHIRIEACDSCKHYLKGVDLTKLGLAVPLVDEIYAAPLDLWAREHGYTKIELNLVGV
jgi:FdhE protein